MKNVRIACALLCVTMLGSCGAPAYADAIDDLVKGEMEKRGIPGLAIAVVRNGEVVKSAGYGFADVELEAPVKADTVFAIRSISKQFVAAGVMLLVEEGKIALDDPIGRHLEGTPPAWAKITVRHLLCQTSGLHDFINEPVLNMRLDATDEELLAAEAARPLKFEPGEAWDYSNTNYHFLAMIIREAGGKPYGEFLAERIFKPLKMDRTAVIRGGEIVPGRALGYYKEGNELRPGAFLAPSIIAAGSGGLRSTALDLAKWDAALYSEQILKRSSLDQMWAPVKLNNGQTHAYGFGWEIADVAGHRQLWHGGNLAGFSGRIDRFPEDGVTVIVLTNLAGAPLGTIIREAAGTYVPALGKPDYKPIEDKEPQTTARLTGLLRRAGSGELKEDDFAPGIWVYVQPYLGQMAKDFTAIGGIQKLTLVQRNDEPAGRSYRYRAQFKATGFIMHFVIDKNDKIVQMMPEEVNQ